VALKLACPVEILIPQSWIRVSRSERDVIESPTANRAQIGPILSVRSRIEAGRQPIAASPPHPPTAGEHRPSLSRAAQAMLAWAVVVAFGMVRLIWVQRRTVRLVRQAQATNRESLDHEFAALQRRSRVKRKVRLLHTAQIRSPVAACPLAPCVVMPTDLLRVLTAKQRRWTLLHEIAHIRRGDLWASLAQSVLQTIFFFNPVVWLAGRMIDSLREDACDDEASALADIGSKESGQGLLAIVEFIQRSALPATNVHAVGILCHQARVRRRIMRLVQRERCDDVRLAWPTRWALGLLAVVMLPSVHAQSGDQTTVAARIAALEAELEILKRGVADESADGDEKSVAEEKAMIKWKGQVVAPGGGRQKYVVREIDTSGLPEQGLLLIQLEAGDGQSGVSFDLFPADTEIPDDPEQQEQLRQTASLASRYDVPPGTKGQIVHPYKRGQKFKLAASGDWASREDSRNTFSVSVAPAEAESIRSITVSSSTAPGEVAATVRRYTPGELVLDASPSITVSADGQLVTLRSGSAPTSDADAVAKVKGNQVGEDAVPVVHRRAAATGASPEFSPLDLARAGAISSWKGVLHFTTSGQSLLESEVRLEGPGAGKQDYRVIDVDTSDFDGESGLLIVKISMGDEKCGGSFDLFPGDVEMPESPEKQEALRVAKGLAHLYDLRTGQSGTLIYPFTKGQKFKLGATGSWGSEAGAENSVKINVRAAKFSSHRSGPSGDGLFGALHR
ncbi:MAG: M56 family metallopeptidase, partial [Planctomycetota bacterium]